MSTTNRVGVRLTARRYVYSVPVVGRAEWIVLDTWDARIARRGSTILEWDPPAFDRFRARIERSAGWTKIFAKDGVLVFRKVAA